MTRLPVCVHKKKEAAMSQTDPLIETPQASGTAGVHRRGFFTAVAGAAAVGAGALALGTPASAQSLGEVDPINFALNLEYLQANFLAVATTGKVLVAADISGTGTAGAANGGRQKTFADPALASIAQEMAADALAHVKFLRSQASTVYAVAQPAIDLGTAPTSAFSTLARAAGLIGASAGFDPYGSDDDFLLGLYMLKDVSVTAYAGILGFLGTPTTAEAVAGIMQVEAEHAATVRLALYRRGLTVPSLIDATEAISNYRDTLDGTSSDFDQGVRPTTDAAGATVANVAPLDSKGQVFTRTPAEVLNILYLNAATGISTGGFFPAGLNGTIKSTTTPAPTPTPTPSPTPTRG